MVILVGLVVISAIVVLAFLNWLKTNTGVDIKKNETQRMTEEEKAILVVINHLVEHPEDETSLNNNFYKYCYKIIAKNGAIYKLDLYEDIFKLYWLIYVYRNTDGSLEMVRYCKKESKEADELKVVLGVCSL